MPFLANRDPRPLTDGATSALSPTGLFLGKGGTPLEVALYNASAPPAASVLRTAHHARERQRATPVIVVAIWGDARAGVATRIGEDVVAFPDLDVAQVERICDAALNLPDRHGAARFVAQAVAQLGTALPGVRNEGLFALHELSAGVRARGDWTASTIHGQPLLSLRGRQLIQHLGFVVHQLPGPAAVLVAKGSKRAIAVFLDRADEIDVANANYDGVSPITYALAKADNENLDYVVVAADSALRVYPVKPGVGTGRRGRTETFIELNLAVLGESDAGFLWLLASADALAVGGTFETVLARSTEYAVELGQRLRDRVYTDVIPPLANALVRAQRLRRPNAVRVAETYEMALLVLFRLLFVAYAEDKDLLPLHTNTQYREHSLKRIAQRLLDDEQSKVEYGRQPFIWTEVQQLWRAVDKGNTVWGVPVYNGGLFAELVAEGATAAGSRLSGIELPDDAFALALSALLIDEATDGTRGPVDFRSLGVREFGTIYEGLLSSELSVAERDLAVDPDGAYAPAEADDSVVVAAGTVYLHNASGARKSTGSYYTRTFVVEHLLDRVLEPALDEHLMRLDGMDEREASDRFFEFRVADIAMGSGHFLVAAVDRIERRLSNYLARRELGGVRDELARLRKSATTSLGTEKQSDPIEDTQLLRRQIARRCVFGVDLNAMAVELARLSLWIHTFVPGLPLSFLNQNLIAGNGLVGIATFAEARDALGGSGFDLFSFTAEERLRRAQEPLARLGRLADATAAEVRLAKTLFDEARANIASEAALLTILAGARIDKELKEAVDSRQVASLMDSNGDLFMQRLARRAESVLGAFKPIHMPIAFPQVFLGGRHGFDVILGNPPWDKVRFEEDAFYGRYIPGLIGLPQARRKSAIAERIRAEPDLAARAEMERATAEASQAYFSRPAGAYSWQGSGHLDTAKLFTERSLRLLGANGRLGYVLPRQCLVLDGWSEIREHLFGTGVGEVAQLRNRNGWLFDDAHHSYLVALLAVNPQPGMEGEVLALPGVDSMSALADARSRDPTVWTVTEMRAHVSESLQVPLFSIPGDDAVFRRLSTFPQLGRPEAGRFWSVPWAVLDVGRDLPGIGLDPRGAYVLRTRNLDALRTTRDADCRRVSTSGLNAFINRKVRGADWAESLGPEGKLRAAADTELLAVVYRYPSRNDDSRTVIASLLPDDAAPAVGYNHALVMPLASGVERLFVLGMLNSLVWDWVARRFTDRHVTASVLRRLPLPVNVDPERLASITAALLADDPYCRRRLARMYTGVSATGQRTDLLVSLQVEAAKLLDVTRAEMTVILADFSVRAIPPDMRQSILRAL